MFKICKKCGEFKEHKTRNDRNGAPQSHCVECQSKYAKKHYEENKADYVKRSRARNNRVKAEMKEYVLSLKQDQPCIDCGGFFPHYVLHFDHLPEFDKSFCIAQSYRWGYSKVLIDEEIAKCELVCANCHSIRTWSRSHNLLPL